MVRSSSTGASCFAAAVKGKNAMNNKAISEIRKIYDNRSELREEAMAALGRAGGDLAVAEIIKLYGNRSELREKAMAALGMAGRPR